MNIVLIANESQLRNIKQLIDIDENRVKSLGGNMYRINPVPVDIEVPELLLNMSVDEFGDEKKIPYIKIKSFKKSKEFYKNSSGKNGYKIVSDEFSDQLNHILYKGFNRIESELRQSALQGSSRGKLKAKSPYYSAKNADHEISTFQLSDFIEKVLKSPASDEYMKAEWRKSENKNEDTLVRIAQLTKIDEINPGIGLEDLKTIRIQRNKCMHFNVTTVQDYESVVPLMNKYLRGSANKAIKEVFAELSVALKKQIDQFAIPVDVIRNFIDIQMKPINDLSKKMKKITDDLRL